MDSAFPTGSIEAREGTQKHSSVPQMRKQRGRHQHSSWPLLDTIPYRSRDVALQATLEINGAGAEDGFYHFNRINRSSGRQPMAFECIMDAQAKEDTPTPELAME